MREILFKGKRKDNGEWIEGYYSKDPDLNIHYISGWNYYYTEDGLEREPFDYEIIPDTLCQYTGRVDRCGDKIWENDIINLDEEIGVIEWQDDESAFVAVFYGWENNLGAFYEWDLEVIGNKFDNPELLEAKE